VVCRISGQASRPLDRPVAAHDGRPTTNVPAPTCRRSTPADTSWSKHATTVPRDTPTTGASTRSAGTRVPGVSTPDVTQSSRQPANR
jgi:hypothetical protein